MRAALALALSVATTVTALADTGPLIVIPGKPGVPVIINGRDASYAVVEGEWGLARNFKNADRVYGGWDSYTVPEVATITRRPGIRLAMGVWNSSPPPIVRCRIPPRAITSPDRPSRRRLRRSRNMTFPCTRRLSKATFPGRGRARPAIGRTVSAPI
jgi:hypothetical protein